MIVLVNVDNEAESTFAEDNERNIYNWLVALLIENQYIIPDRTSIDSFLSELRIQSSNMTEAELASLGGFFNARMIMTVNVTIPESYKRIIEVKINDIESSQVYHTNQVLGTKMDPIWVLDKILELLPQGNRNSSYAAC